MSSVRAARNDKTRPAVLIKSLLKSQMLAVLATDSGKQPYTSLVGFAFKKDLKEIYFATPAHTAKFRNISANPLVSLIIDSRANKAADFNEAKAATALGEAKPAGKREKEKIKHLYLERFPHLKSFTEEPDSVFIKIIVDKYILVQRFQETTEVKIKSRY